MGSANSLYGISTGSTRFRLSSRKPSYLKNPRIPRFTTRLKIRLPRAARWFLRFLAMSSPLI